MRSKQGRIELIAQVGRESYSAGVVGCRAEDAQFDGHNVTIAGRRMLNFASCSYLGLEVDPRLIGAAVEAIHHHGIQVSSSRTYVSSPLYEIFEQQLAQIFGNPVVVAPTTTLGHLSAIPILVGSDDAVILDHQVHASVQMACRVVKADGVHVEIVPHNGLGRIERRVRELAKKHRQVWYMADGVHSMTGRLAPTDEISAMLDRHDQMRFYVDDAHGMSWCGTHGAGSILDAMGLHPRMVLTSGLAKGFGTGGGVLVVPDDEERTLVSRYGPTLIFGGPLQPAVLGAAIASAKIHLSPEIGSLQEDLRLRMEHRNQVAETCALPMTSSADTPVGFVPVGPIKAAHSLCQRLAADGFFINPAQFPAVPVRRSGGRFLLTRHQSFDDIERLVESIARHWEPALADAGTSPQEVSRIFKFDLPEQRSARVKPTERDTESLVLECADSIDKLTAHEWDLLHREVSCFGSSALRVMESVFGRATDAQDHWDFRYYIVRDTTGAPVLATCFTAALWKGDMLSSADVSRAVERRRESEPHFLTQRVFAMGSLLSEGEHLWLRDDPSSALSRLAIRLLLDAVRRDAALLRCDVRVIREIPDSSMDLRTVLEEEGFLRAPAPESWVLADVCANDDELMSNLTQRQRHHQRRQVQPFNDAFEIEIISDETGGDLDKRVDLDRLQALYQNVQTRSLEINTFPLPLALIAELIAAPGWELSLFRLAGQPDGEVVGFGFAYTRQSAYAPVFLGMDYVHVEGAGLYRQMLRSVVNRARALGKRSIRFGLGAGLEKMRFGARAVSASMYMEADDHYAMDAVAQFSSSGSEDH